MGATSISWTDKTWNPVRGCSRVSEGCRHCYAERVAARFSDPGQPYEGLARRKYTIVNNEERDPDNRYEPRWTGEVKLIADHLSDPLRWRKPARVFVNSMSDLFHEKLTNEQIAAVFGVMAAAPQHTFQILTKRAKRMREWFEWVADHGTQSARAACRVAASDRLGKPVESAIPPAGGFAWPLPNIWIGVSVENQDAADERIPSLLSTPATVRFLSCEPLLGAVNLRHLDADAAGHEWCQVDALTGEQTDMGRPCPPVGSRIDWVIAGAESGPRARVCDVAWLRSLRDQCAAARVSFFLKQAVAPKIGRCEDGCNQEVTVYVHSRGNASYSCGCTNEGGEDGDSPFVGPGEGSREKGRGFGGPVVELPYLDGVQHAAFPR